VASVLLVLAPSSGGIARHVRAAARGLAERGIDVTVLAPEETIAALDLEHTVVRAVARPVGTARPAAVRAVRTAVRQEAARVELVHAHGIRAGAACAAFAPTAPLIVTWHNARLGGRGWQLTHRAVSRYVARRTDLTLAASDDLAADARRSGATLVHTAFVAAPTLPAPSRGPGDVHAELGIAGRPIVLAVGRLQRQKRLDVLVDAAVPWAAERSAPYVVIAGDGPERDNLSAQIDTTGAPVVLLGHRNDIADLLGAADVLALPSEWEAQALVAQEALRAGVPLVTTGVGGLERLIGGAAVTVPVGDPVALRAAVERVLADEEYRDSLIAAGRSRAYRWPSEQESLDDLVASYRDLLRRVEQE
jgi:glycosyltransferase involved in cell wall biosynthesis